MSSQTHVLRKPKASAMSRKGNYSYVIKPEKLEQRFQKKVIQLFKDEKAREFLEVAEKNFNRLINCKQIMRNIAVPLLKIFGYPMTSTNAILNCGAMHVISSNQFWTLIDGGDNLELGHRGNIFLDIGAGSGDVTKEITKFYKRTICTEVNKEMARVLRKHYEVILTNSPGNCCQLMLLKGEFDLITCFNVLDRCSKPISLTRELHSLCHADTTVIVSFVIPFKPWVEYSKSHRPEENLIFTKTKCSWEEHVSELAELLFEKNGFQVEAISRVPYFCDGDLVKPWYVLDDAIFVLKPCGLS